MKNLISLLVVVLMTTSVSFGQTKSEKKKIKEEKKEQGFQEMKDLINSGIYEFEGEWATSNRGRRINLNSNPTFLRMNNEEAEAFFPFFGERFSGAGGYGTDSGIEFENGVSDYEVSYNEKKKQVLINFIADGKSDKYTFKITVFQNGNTSIIVTSNHRSIMRYEGTMQELKTDQ